jgi:hypothetical protein
MKSLMLVFTLALCFFCTGVFAQNINNEHTGRNGNRDRSEIRNYQSAHHRGCKKMKNRHLRKMRRIAAADGNTFNRERRMQRREMRKMY